MGDMERFDSTALFSIFKNEEGDNLLPFEDMEALLDLGPLLEVPLTSNAPLVTTEGPFAPNQNVLGTSEVQPAAAAVLPSTSGGAESAHTRATGWGSNPSSEGADSDGSDMQGLDDQKDAGAPSSTITGGGGGGGGGRAKGGKGSSGVKKRRQRNAEQMESNRVAQQKYRQRKKQEQSVLQQAVDMLTAQLTALKAVEVRNVELEAANAALQATVTQQSSSITALQQHTVAQASELEATRNALAASQAQVASQGKHILDQQAKLKLQEEVIASLKDRLKERIDEAMMHVVPGTVCEKMVAAVKATLYGAKDVNGLQETLAKLPDHLVTELCKNIFQVCKETWPELRTRCGRQVGGPCMTGAA